MASAESSTTTTAISIKPKKEKSSKKRKAEEGLKELSEPNISSSTELTAFNSIEREVLGSGATTQTTKTGAGAAAAKPPSSKKRKTVVEEIEVDITAPEPPSKKALRLLKKGKPLPPLKSGAASTPEPEPKNPKLEREKKSEHGIWIGNLPFYISKTELREFFVSKSDITEEQITRVHMPGPNDAKSANRVEQKRDGKTVHNKGFAYVDLVSLEVVKEALDLSEQLLGGRRVLIKDNKSFEGRPQKTKEESRKEGKPPSKKIFLGNLPFDATEDSIREHFEQCGIISSIKLATFEDSGKCKGYAWIVFEELEAAESAVRGFFLVEEEDSETPESEDGTDVSEGPHSEKAVSKLKPKKTRKSKTWVNRIKGRPLRMEFAEDDQTRYSKRYRKEGTKTDTSELSEQSMEAFKENVVVSKAVEYRQSYAPRLTGGIVESKGKKVTF